MGKKKRIIRRVKTVTANIALYADQLETIDELSAQWRSNRSATIRRIFEEWRADKQPQHAGRQ